MRFVIAAFFLVKAVVTFAQPPSVDQMIESLMAKRKIPGLALAVVEQGKVIFAKGYGQANLELGVPVTPDTVFDLASITKPITASCLMLLVQESKVGLDDPVAKYVPGAPTAWEKMTVRHLLQHTSGLADLDHAFTNIGGGGLWAEYPKAEMLKAVIGRPADFAPGAGWQYSDDGYFTLGVIIERASGQRYQDFVTSRFFAPLGMSTACFIDQWQIVRNRASGYTLRNGAVAQIRRIWQIELNPFSGARATLRDMLRWEEELRSKRVLFPSTLDQMWTEGELNTGDPTGYGLGWFIRNLRGYRVIEHSGSTGTDFYIIPEKKIAAVVLTNLDGHTGSDPRSIAESVLGLLHPELRAPRLIPEATDPDAALSRKCWDFLRSVAAGGPDPGTGVPGLFDALSRKLGAAEKAAIAAQLGTASTFAFLAADPAQSPRPRPFGAEVVSMRHLRVKSPKESANYSFWLTADQRLAAIDATAAGEP